MLTNLERLNELLHTQDIPTFRKTVSPSLNNLKWLRVTLANKPDTSLELKMLLVLNPKEMRQPYFASQ